MDDSSFEFHVDHLIWPLAYVWAGLLGRYESFLALRASKHVHTLPQRVAISPLYSCVPLLCPSHWMTSNLSCCIGRVWCTVHSLIPTTQIGEIGRAHV